MRDRDLRTSLQKIGPQKCGLEYQGAVIDGRRRAAICAELGLEFSFRRCATLQDACTLLWLEHPERALALAGARPLLELVELCSTTPVAVARVLQARPKEKRKPGTPGYTRKIAGQPYPELKRAKKMVRRLFVLEPELYAYAREAAAQKGHRNVSRLVREALWKEVALTVPNAPQFQPRRVQPPNGVRVMTRRRTG